MKDDTRNFLPRSERHASLDLLDQVESDQAVRDNVRRLLGDPVKGIGLRGQACSRCESGLTHCTTPDACERAERDDGIGAIRGVVYAIPLALALWAVAVFWWMA